MQSMTSISNSIAFMSVGALMEFQNSMRRTRAMEASCAQTDAFTRMRNELVYERCMNDALLKRIAQLEKEIDLLEEQIDEPF